MIDLRIIEKKLKDFRKFAKLNILSRDIMNRDIAVCYIDGEFIEGKTHALCVNEYLQNKFKEHLNEDYSRPALFTKYYKEESDYEYLPSALKEDIDIVKDNIQQIAFAHKINGDIDEEVNDSIFIEKDTLYNIDINTAINLFKEHYPNDDIYIDETSEKVAKDLRKKIVALKIKPKDSKEEDFHLALSQYLYKELKSQGLKVSKQDVILKVTLSSKHKDKYEHVIIDCLAGKLYLRGKEVTDKYFGRLRKFQGGQRQSDAYHCACQSITRILERIEKIEQELKTEEKEVFGAVNRVDLRGHKNIIRIDERKHKKHDMRKKIDKRNFRKIANKKIIDLRGQRNIIRIDMRKAKKDLRKLAYHDNYNRELAILYVNGEVYEESSHARALEKYLNDKNIDNKLDNSRFRSEYDDNVHLTDSSAVCHYVKDKNAIFIEPDTLINVDIDTVKSALLKKYPNVQIYLDNEYERAEDLEYFERVADMRKHIKKDFRKLARNNNKIKIDNSKESAIIGRVWHPNKGILFRKIKNASNAKLLFEEMFAVHHIPKNIDDILESDVGYEHHSFKNNTMVLNEAGVIAAYTRAKQQNLTGEPMKHIEKHRKELELSSDNKIKSKLLINDMRKLARRDIHDRDENDGAIVYIDGEVLSGYSHAECISEYLKNKFNKKLNDEYSRPIAFDPGYAEYKDQIEYGKKDKEDIENIMNNVKQMAFAHKTSEDNSIYVEEPSLFNISLTEASNAIKTAYPDYDIYSDDTDKKVAKKDLRSIRCANKHMIFSDYRKSKIFNIMDLRKSI